jgi:uncharacterized protein (TIGR01244 family)
MNYQTLTDRYAVAAQIQASDVADLKADGFTTIICNRPDGEEPGQPTAADIAQACAQAGVAFLHCPMRGPEAAAEDVDQLRDLLAQPNEKVFAFCRTGNRSGIFYQKATS